MNIKKRKIDFFPYLMSLPAILAIGGICLFPLLQGIYLSFTVTKLTSPDVMRFVGVENFKRLMSDKNFWSALWFTIVYTFVSTVAAYFAGLIVALMMNREIRVKNVVRALLLLPWVVPAVVGTTSWTWILNDQTGVVNNFLKQIGLIEKSILFLADPQMAKITVIIFCIWKTFPFMAIVILASLQSISADYHDAAMIDGAGILQRFFHITLPMIKRESLLAIILMIMWNFNRMDFIYLMTEGGPVNSTRVVSIYSYYTAFFRGSIGYASTISVAMMVIMSGFLIVYYRLKKGEMEE